ncbi:MAG TPA: hypothetical protein DDW52_13910 [Planctomycetaceae bacterium]|nr:hypothetical protein [Planctomycetaceae bacterium]
MAAALPIEVKTCRCACTEGLEGPPELVQTHRREAWAHCRERSDETQIVWTHGPAPQAFRIPPGGWMRASAVRLFERMRVAGGCF